MANSILDYELIKDIRILYRKKIIIYGTAVKANQVLSLIEHAKLSVVGVCDGNKAKQGGIFGGHIIKDISEVLDEINDSELLVVVCSSFVKDIITYCTQFSSVLQFVTQFGLEHAFCLNRKNEFLDEEFRNWYNRLYDSWAMIKNEEQEAVNRKEYFNILSELKCNNPVLVYTCGKVGSASIYHTLVKNNIPAQHVHWLRPQYAVGELFEQDLKRNKEYLKEYIAQKETVKIITALREPISRNLSLIFQLINRPSLRAIQNMDYDLCKSIKEILISGVTPAEEKMTGEISEDRFELLYDWERWFRVEMQEVFGIDVFSQEFDKEKGYTIIRKDNVECLVLTLEKMDQCRQIISEFVRCEKLEWHTENVGKNKPYKYVYEGLKRELELDKEILNLYYCNDSIKHFYTEEEIVEFREKWEKNS